MERFFGDLQTFDSTRENNYFSIGGNDYYFNYFAFQDDDSDITACNYSYTSYDLSDSVSFGSSSAKDILPPQASRLK